MEKKDKQKKNRASSIQVGIIVDFMEKHPALIHYKVSPTISPQQRELLWKELCDQLNHADKGAIKNETEWRRTWTDVKNRIKEKVHLIEKQREANGTEAVNEISLNPLEKRIAVLMGLCDATELTKDENFGAATASNKSDAKTVTPLIVVVSKGSNDISNFPSASQFILLDTSGNCKEDKTERADRNYPHPSTDVGECSKDEASNTPESPNEIPSSSLSEPVLETQATGWEEDTDGVEIKRRVRATPEQLDLLTSFIEKNKHLVDGKLCVNPKDKRTSWDALADFLNNARKGPPKSVLDWRNTWKYFKYRVKEKAKDIVYYQQMAMTGIKPVICEKRLSSLEKRVISLVPKLQKYATEIKEFDADGLVSSHTNVSNPSSAFESNSEANEVCFNEDSSQDNALLEDIDTADDEAYYGKELLGDATTDLGHRVGSSRLKRKSDEEIQDDDVLNTIVLVEKKKSRVIEKLVSAVTETNSLLEKMLENQEQQIHLMKVRNSIERKKLELKERKLKSRSDKNDTLVEILKKFTK